ncbi:SusC/RagA family TonB-linked outer membrane protein [Flavilitoribacter nigricans]|uniref:SusC/RagA family TonB-linked outer membrane protein n=1 Tax=Flavilitoribacter nigricans (strain ATCC 23147 / DSM 23189 / NBRC 102662 / NCIMB 1420 / SS-2) TaxID=1122177 RepID=A0A2D0NDN6_FLAN2|nr:SusC/RagA family TonB-linked outer membrane protein [Flavilitoribacter nigricans]PHN06518.1 SusC/RagA family TonB-linked outer membrane protein [Flavilitoribacter nigricans DSM 23189 = NBRC 102662]
MNKYTLLIFLICLLSRLAGWGQVTFSGLVTDKLSGEALPFVNVSSQGSSFGTTTDSEGRYELTLQAVPEALIFSYVGYATRTEPVDGRTQINISLDGSTTDLSEVVVTALGLKRDKRDLGYAVQKLDNEELTTVRQTNTADALAGRVAGVQVTHGGSGIGSSTRVVIRGETSLSGSNQPLFVIDGIPVSNELLANPVEGSEAGFQEVDYGNGFAEISADDIESITVLKGPGAAALYGNRAAGGVVVIETKDGSQGQGIGVSINSQVTVDQISTYPQYQNVYGQGSGGVFAYEDGFGGGIGDGGLVSFGPELNGQLIPQYDSPSTDINGQPVRAADILARDGNPITATPFVAHPDNVKNFFETGLTSIQNIALSGANPYGSFRVSYSRLDNEGIIPNTDLKRNGLSLSGSYQLSERLSVRAFGNFINSSSTHRPALGYGSENLFYLFSWMGRQVNLENTPNYWQAGQQGFRQFGYNYQWLDNPYFSVYENTNGFSKDRILGNISLQYALSDKLNLRFRSGIDSYDDLRQARRAFSTQRFPNGAYKEEEVRYQESNHDLLLSYRDQIGSDWNFSLGIGGYQFRQTTGFKSTIANQLSVPNIYNFGNSKVPLVVFQENAQKRINSVYGMGTLNYRNRFFLDLTLRNDWSSTLPADNNSFAYYSASTSLVLSEFLALPNWLTYAKARLSLASVGNDTDPLQLNNTLVFNQNYGAFPLLTNSATLLNARLRPERINALEGGLELWFFNDRVGVDLSWYRNVASDQIIALPASAASGYTDRIVNGGKIRSQGLEVVLNLVPVRTPSFSWETFVNFSRGNSYVDALPEGIDRYVTGYTRLYASTENSVFYIADPDGGRIGDMYGTGFRKTEDGQIIYGANGLPIRDTELRYLGNYNPDFIVGMGNRFSYKNFSLNVLLDWRQGGVIVSRMLAIGSTSGVLEHTLAGRETGIVGEGVVNQGTEESQEYVPNTTTVSAAEYYNQFYNRANEESALYDASYLKLRQVGIQYTLPKSLTRSWGVEEIRVGLVGNNLLIFTENPHFDPELSAMQGRNFAYGVEDMAYPGTRSFGFNLGLKF